MSLIEIYSKLSVPPLNPFAKTVPVPSPPVQPGVVLSVIGGNVVVVVVVANVVVVVVGATVVVVVVANVVVVVVGAGVVVVVVGASVVVVVVVAQLTHAPLTTALLEVVFVNSI